MGELTIGNKAPQQVNAVIEIPKHSGVKYEVHKKTGMIKVNRFLFTSARYPYNYGFIPETLENDNDPLDLLVISDEPVVPGCIVEVRPVGILRTQDENGVDDKIIAVPLERIDPTFSKIKDLKDLDDPVLKRIAHFFGTYKELEPKKWVKVLGFGGRAKAIKCIEQCIRRYKAKQKKQAKKR
ncbi:MAG: inorganic diphosphatase [Candidatus Diapherotrites archaeon]